MSKKIVFDEKQTKEIIEYYLYPHSLNDTTKFAGITKNQIIHKLLVENNIPLHSKELAVRLQKASQAKNYKAKGTNCYEELLINEELKAKIKYDYIELNMQFKDLLEKYNITYKMLGKLLQAWEIKKDKSKQTENITKNKFLKYNINKKELQEYFDIHRVEDCAKHFNIPLRFLYKCIKEYNIEWDKHRINIYNGSAPEEDYYKELVAMYGENNVIRQYKDERYPFHCDFYIKSEDLFIELNLHWTHGGHVFDKNNPNDLLLLNKWKEQAITSAYYKGAIEVWTVRDPLKLEYFKKNNLNYQIIY